MQPDLEEWPTLADAARALRAGTVSSEELVRRGFARADLEDSVLGVYVRRFDEAALKAARAADAELRRGLERGPLHGLPIGVKDTIATGEGPTSGNSAVEYPQWSRSHDATVVKRLRASGAVIVGKTSAMEFAIGVPDPEKPFPVPRNPWDASCYPGGSSTGSGAGIASGMFPGALGTDTAGSIRIPAAYCGITGFKGTYGLVSNWGTMPLAPSLDVVGPMARSAADVALILRAIAGFDPRDPASRRVGVRGLSLEPARSLAGVRIGVERHNHVYGEFAGADMVHCFEDAVDELGRAGAVVREVEIPHYREVTDSVLLTMFCEGLACHHRALREQWGRFGRSARVALAGATAVRAHEYVSAQKVRRLGRRLISELFENVDVIVCPTTATAAPAIEGLDLGAMIRTLFTNLWSGVGGPAISVPMGFDDRGLPLGLQIAGPAFGDALVLRVADAYQRATDWHLRTPAVMTGTERRGSDGR